MRHEGNVLMSASNFELDGFRRGRLRSYQLLFHPVKDASMGVYLSGAVLFGHMVEAP